MTFSLWGGSSRCAYLVVLIRSHGNEIRFRENIRPEGAVRELENVVGAHNVKPRLVFVHGVQNGLQHTTRKEGKKKNNNKKKNISVLFMSH